MPDKQHTSKHYERQLRLLKDKLLLISPNGNEWSLNSDGQSGFWAGEEGEPPREQINFDTPVHGKTLRCILSGLSYYRTFTP